MSRERMSKSRWERIKRIFARARKLPAPEQDAYLLAECRADATMLAQVRRLLAQEKGLGNFLRPPDKDDLRGALPHADANLQGVRLGDFELVREIGRGAMGVVYLARQLSLDRKVAVKILAPQLCASAERKERFRREALAASRLLHPNIVSIIAFDEHASLRYLAMEYVAGRSLQECITELREARRDGRLPAPETQRLSQPEAAARILLGVARALEHCHAFGIIHRDVKPHNILIDHRGEPRLVDFGLAKDLDLESLSHSGTLTGTPHYMSPEQAQALDDEIDHRTDVYSAGAVLYELLTLERPFDGPNSPAVLYNITHEEARPIVALAPDVPAGLQGICRKAMSKSTADRYRTAGELASDLERFLKGARVKAPPPSAVRRGYDYVFHRHARAAATAAVALFAVFVLLYPPDISAEDSHGQHEGAWSMQLAPAEWQAQQRRRANQEYIEYLRTLLPQEPVYHDR